MRTDILGEFIEKLNSFIGDVVSISNDSDLQNQLFRSIRIFGSSPGFNEGCFLYEGSRVFFRFTWNKDKIFISKNKDVDQITSFRRNELDPIILCLEQPNLRKFTDEYMTEAISAMKEIRNRIVSYNQSKQEAENES